jgi:hypothetical protein
VVDDVGADKLMSVDERRHLQLRANPIDTGDERRARSSRSDAKEAAEVAQPAEHAIGVRGRSERCDARYDGVAGVDIDTGVAVAQRLIRLV